MNYFSSFHPVTLAIYFASVLAITMFAANPILLLIALIGGALFYLRSKRDIRLFRELGFYILLFVAVAVTNPLFSHSGVTVMFFMNGNPVTLEAVLYGINIALMLIAVIHWFKCFNLVMTDDKLLFLFGKISPKTALLLSSVLRFIPLLKEQSKKIRDAQKTMGLFDSDSLTDKLRGTVRVYSALITWSLENAVDTGASMKARGYGLKNRSHYSLYSFKKYDALLLVLIALSDVAVALPGSLGKLSFTFYPSISHAPIDVYNLSAITAFALLCLLPLMLEVKEDLKWKYYILRI